MYLPPPERGGGGGCTGRHALHHSTCVRATLAMAIATGGQCHAHTRCSHPDMTHSFYVGQCHAYTRCSHPDMTHPSYVQAASQPASRWASMRISGMALRVFAHCAKTTRQTAQKSQPCG